MGYAETLSIMVMESGLSLRQIADRCNEKGQPIAPSYISKLQTGKQTPASEGVSRAIAEVCGGDPDVLVWEGYMEKAPEIIREYVNATLPGIKSSMTMMFPKIFPKDQAEILKEAFDKLFPIELVKMFKAEAGNVPSFVEGLSLVHKEQEDSQIDMSAYLGIIMFDDSMHPLIPRKAFIKYNIEGEIENGTVIVIKKDNQYFIRRFYQNDLEVILVPENLKYDLIFTEIRDLDIIGVVKSYSYNLY